MPGAPLGSEHAAVRRAAAEFASRHLAPAAKRVDAARELDANVLAEARKLGFYGLNVPQEFGGLGLDTVGIALVAAEMGRACGSTALSIFAHNVLCVEHIRRVGSAAQKHRFLPKLASGEWIGAWGLTEPSGGSDVLGMRTRAERTADGWVLNGEKCFITNGSKGSVVIVMARTSSSPKGGVSAFIVPKGTRGFTGLRSHELACMRASDTATLRLEDCRLPAEALLGTEGRAIKEAFGCLDLERVVAGALLTALARECVDRSVAYAKERQAFGKPIAQFQSIYSKLANLDAEAEACDLLWRNAAARRDRGEDFTREAAIAKLHAARLAERAALEAIHIHGGAGLEVTSELERFLRDSLLGPIGGGTSEVQELVIARGLGIEVGLSG
ncbi:MAG: acyl-CoA dehydrogenase family protein [Thermoplasmatota archaeon]